jgi:hypothetical protein
MSLKRAIMAIAVALLPAAAPGAGAWPGGERICELAPDAGPCDGICPRWFFNGETGTCEEFIWGCCGGNANNFETLEACEAACAKAGCPADVDGDGEVGMQDLLVVLKSWNESGGPADVNGDGVVGVEDLLALLASWGACT